MPYDHHLADRIRNLLSTERNVTEKAMFGGLAFLVGGNMAVAASGKGGILVRVDPASSDALVAKGLAKPMVMRGRAMAGWLRVDAEALEGRALKTWVARGVKYAGSLPVKTKKRAARRS
jgi:TfoX/Sxy family transcriptional regulator of competence genes